MRNGFGHEKGRPSLTLGVLPLSLSLQADKLLGSLTFVLTNERVPADSTTLAIWADALAVCPRPDRSMREGQGTRGDCAHMGMHVSVPSPPLCPSAPVPRAFWRPVSSPPKP